MPAKIIAIFNQKGGCAKTMTTMQLAGAFALRGLKVFVADVDPQNTSALWGLAATDEEPFPATVMSLAVLQENFLEKLLPIVDKYDAILIDCPPSLNSRVPWAALSIADLAIVPVIPVMDNVWASKAAEDLLFEARQARVSRGIVSELKAAYLLSLMRRGKIYTACLDHLRKMARIPILKSSVSHRNAFAESQLYGSCVKAMSAAQAAQEVDAVANEIAAMLGLKLKKAA